MDDAIAPDDLLGGRPPLPLPTRLRWQPLRLGLVELFHYDSEEFWFRDGHLLLRGNNGTGKSKVLSLTLPFLFDANLRSSRIEPDGDPGKKMSWNLLVGRYPRRMGYAWIEFGRLGEDGVPRFLTLGAGLSAVESREVDSWYFILDEAGHGPRIGKDLWLVNDRRVVLTRERLRETVDGHGQVFDVAQVYRRAVDERLFQLGAKRYDALMDTLIQLRQPQLSRRPDEAALSNALTEALPPLARDLLVDVADALNQLDEGHAQLKEFEQLAGAVEQFDRRYRVYAATASRRRARELRQAQTEHDNASRARNDAQTRLQQARQNEVGAQTRSGEAELTLAGCRERLETLQADPTIQDATRLEQAEKDLAARRDSVGKAAGARSTAIGHLDREAKAGAAAAERLARSDKSVAESRTDCRTLAETVLLVPAYSANPLAESPIAGLSSLPLRDVEAAQADLLNQVAMRRDHLALLRRHREALNQAQTVLAGRQQAVRDRLDDHATALERRRQADAAVEGQGKALVEAWIAHFDGLRQLRCDPAEPLSALADWVVGLDGENPASAALRSAQFAHAQRLASQVHQLKLRQADLQHESRELETERNGLVNGKDAVPPTPHTRGADTRRDRAGAPLWQLVDFQDRVDAAARAGLEAGLEASGLLDAWVTPDGQVIGGDGRLTWQDSQLLFRPSRRQGSLADWLRADPAAEDIVPRAIIDRLLGGIAGGEGDDGEAETWISPTGRYRVGGLAGAWSKAEAVYIGFAARAAARSRRLAQIAARLDEVSQELTAVGDELAAVADARRVAETEWEGAPSDGRLRQAHSSVAAAVAAVEKAKGRLEQAQEDCREAELVAEKARDTLVWDAKDLGLPIEPEALQTIESGLNRFSDACHRLIRAVEDVRRAFPELERQREREAQAQEAVETCTEALAVHRIEEEQARQRYETLKGAVGLKVEAMRQRIADARGAVTEAERAVKAVGDALREIGEARAVAVTEADVAERTLAQTSEARTQAVGRLQQFAATSLLSSALPELELPDFATAWTIDPALTVARRVEQALAETKDDDDAWTKIQRRVTEDLQELHRALSALGHQAPAETTDWGLVVHIIYQNRPERPDALVAKLKDEIAQRSELLTAREREVLENHLQAEIAHEIQRLLQSAERQLLDINAELHQRPTSKGIRYRLQWEPLGDKDGAPVGLAEARRKLLNTSADLWTAEDRRIVGAMLQQRIAAERERSDSGGVGAEGSSLTELLANALDYRHWHRFRVERYQDGQWRKLSGPASSGERALGLTVPLFAAISSFYGQGGSRLAPRLMLLDEAFAGIDDTARVHCMGLIREFDLDFVITSEREWGCYAALPGVAICDLQSREGIDAIYVSRWTWDGRAKTRDEDPDRRFTVP
ncbi:MAG: TIGR02680 family protein [Magnetospirillum sp.]|nr:TIGR02680 family protein [Magnetospirillum sp.]